MIARNRFLKFFFASFLICLLFFTLSVTAKSEEEKVSGEHELGAAGFFIFLFDGDVETVRDIRYSGPLWKNFSNRDVFVGLFIDWYLPDTHKVNTGRIVKTTGEGGASDIESVVPHLTPIVVDDGPVYTRTRTVKKPVNEATKRIVRAIIFMHDVRIQYIMNHNIIILMTILYRLGYFNTPSEPRTATDTEIDTVKTSMTMIDKAVESRKQPDKSRRMDKGVCFAPDTLVVMGDGSLKKIKDIENGDSVMGYDFGIGRSVAFEVLSVTATPHENIYILNESIEVTGEHPFYPEAGESVKVKDFAGMVTTVLGDSDGNTNTLEGIEVKNIKSVEPGGLYYDLRLEEIHTYFVADDEGNLYLVGECREF
jgi:hypothetical protein